MKAKKTVAKKINKEYSRLLRKDSLFATIFIFIIIYFFYFLIELNFKAFTIIDNSYQDVDFTDILYSRSAGNSTALQQLATKDIVLVNIGNIKRDRMAVLLDSIDHLHPRLTAIDIFFNHDNDPFNTDSSLKATLHTMQPLVMASLLPHKNGEIKKSNPWYGNFNYGYVNFVIDDSFSVVRKFAPYIINKKDTQFSFAAEVVRQIDENAFLKMLDRGKRTEIINYQASENNFITIEADSIFKGDQYIENTIKDHIVLIGYISEDKKYPKLRDRFFTPMNPTVIGRSHPDAVGLVINANIILMMLKGNYISHMPWLLIFILAFLFCYMHIYLFIKIKRRWHLWHHLIIKGIQIFSATAVLLLALSLYKFQGIKMDIGLIMLSILVSVDLLYFYEALIKYCNQKFNISTTFVNTK